MILLIVWDGLRPDMITLQRTPFLRRTVEQGVLCQASHAAFPTSTRVNSASLTTGCHPGRHGIVDNERYIPPIDPQRAVTFADWRVLQRMADLEGERLVSVPTLGEILRAAGKRMASAGSGSPGTTYLTNPMITGPVVNWATAWPPQTQQEIRQRYGSFLAPEATAAERNRFIFEVVQDHLIPGVRPDVLTLWITEPDHAQHRHGLGSPEALAALAELDQQLEDLVYALDRKGSGEEHTYILLSDHGFSTISKRVAVDARLVEAGLKGSPDSNEILYNCNSFYVADIAPERLSEVVHFLAGEPWIGALFVRDDLIDVCPGAMPQSAAFGAHRRSSELMFAYRWWPAKNEHGVPGSSASSSTIAATHGSASSYDINNCLVAWGKGVKRGTVSQVPCGIVDVAPTVLQLLGIEPPATMEGRVLHELLADGPHPEDVSVSHARLESVYPSAEGSRHQVAWYSQVNGHRYLDQVTFGA